MEPRSNVARSLTPPIVSRPFVASSAPTLMSVLVT